MYNKLKIFLSVILCLSLIGCSNQANIETDKNTNNTTNFKDDEIVTTTEPQIDSLPSIDTSVSFDEIYYAYKENELRADDTYKNNRYRITAKINGMSTGGLLNLSGGATLTMETQVDNTIVFFYAEFEKEQEEPLKTVNVGDTISFEGECLSAGTWVDCELIK